MTINLKNNRHAFAVWATITLASSAACFGLVAATGSLTTTAAAAETPSVMQPVHAWTFDACAMFDAWGETQCLQANYEGRPTDVVTYEDGSQVAHRAWAGFTQRDYDTWTACMPDAACND